MTWLWWIGGAMVYGAVMGVVSHLIGRRLRRNAPPAAPEDAVVAPVDLAEILEVVVYENDAGEHFTITLTPDAVFRMDL